MVGLGLEGDPYFVHGTKLDWEFTAFVSSVLGLSESVESERLCA